MIGSSLNTNITIKFAEKLEKKSEAKEQYHVKATPMIGERRSA